MQAENNSRGTFASTVYEGDAGSGKTNKIISDIVILTSNATDKTITDNILVLCASPLAAQTFKHTLDTQLNSNTQAFKITTARELALEILGDSNVVKRNGREAHMLSNTSFRIFIEDMKTTGLNPKRLQEMLLFFYKSFTNLDCDQQNWLVSEEERLVYATLQRTLNMRRAYIEPQLSYSALHAIQDNPALRSRFSVAHVFIDDYQTLNRASQLLVCTLAEESLTASFDPTACVEVFDSYPYGQGLEELTRNYPQTQLTTLNTCKKPAGIANALQQLKNESNGQSKNIFTSHTKENININVKSTETTGCQVSITLSPLDEFKQIAGSITQLRQNEPECSIAVAVPNTSWAINCSKALTSAGVANEQPLKRAYCIAGRDLVSKVNARVVTLLRLIANPRDALAWRDWCGFGDHLANSSAFDLVARYSETYTLTLPQALDTLANNKPCNLRNSVSLEEVLSTFKATKSVLKRMCSKNYINKEELLNEVIYFVSNGHIQKTSQQLAQLCLTKETISTRDTIKVHSASQLARTMCMQTERLLTAPRQLDPSAVLIAPFDSLLNCSVDILFITGLVNGFFPNYDYFDTTVTMLDRQASVHQNNASMLYTLAGAAQKRLFVSSFKAMELEAAEKLRVKVARIYLKNNQRVCQTVPSDFLGVF